MAQFDLVLATQPARRTALRGRLGCIRLLRRFAEAERILVAEIEQRPNYPELMLELAWTYAWMEQREKELVQYERRCGSHRGTSSCCATTPTHFV